ESSNRRSNFRNPRLVLHPGGRKSFSISQDGGFANDDASNNGDERTGEGRRLAARAFVRWINISGAGGGGLDRAGWNCERDQVSKWWRSKKRRYLDKTRCFSGRGAVAHGASRFGTGERRSAAQSRSGRTPCHFEGGAGCSSIEIQQIESCCRPNEFDDFQERGACAF